MSRALQDRWYREGYFGADTLTDALRRGAESHPDAFVLFHSEHRPARATLAELHDAGLRLAAALHATGLGPGDVVAIQVPNWVEGTLVYQAAMLLGAVIVPIVHSYGPAEVGFILRQSEAKAFVVPDRWRSIDYVGRMDELGPTPALEQLIVIGESVPAGALAWEELVARRAPPFAPVATSPDDVCLVVYTSGTTGQPKGVQHTHNTLLAEVRSTASLLGRPGSTVLGVFPAGHIAGVLQLLRGPLLGTNTVSIDRWDAELAAALVVEHGVVSSSGTPFFLTALLDVADRDGVDLSSLRGYLVGAANVSPELVARAGEGGIAAYRSYGSTEHPVLTTGSPDDPFDKRACTDGRPTPGNEIRIVDDEGRDVRPGEEGEVVCRGPEQFVGYRDRSADEGAWFPDAWFRTGDVGRLDGDGFLTITDRKKDIIIRGGENISSKEVEDALARHPAVVEAAVVAGPDARYGEQVCAFVIVRPDATVDVVGLRRHVADEGLAHYKAPERVVVVDELPRTASGKVRKVDLRRAISTAGTSR